MTQNPGSTRKNRLRWWKHGGILGAIFIGVEPRVEAAALIVAGGNISPMVHGSQHHNLPAIREYLRKANTNYEELQELFAPIDPLNPIGNLAPRPVVFHLGKFDTIVPLEAGRQLYAKAGQPRKFSGMTPVTMCLLTSF